jgi:beta-lactamase class A
MSKLSRRSIIGAGGAATAAAVLGATTPAVAREGGVASATMRKGPQSAAEAARRIRLTYEKETARAGGTWRSMVTVLDADGSHVTAVEQRVDEVVQAYSVNKIAIACAVMDKIDRSKEPETQEKLRLGDLVDLDPTIILGGSGIYFLHSVWGDRLTVGNILTALLLMSDNTAVRLCGLVCAPAEINAYLQRKGFTDTRVIPAANPRRMYLGTTTARETHTLLTKLSAGTMVSAESTRFLLTILRWINGYHDGVRRHMSSSERARIAVKYGAYDEPPAEAGRHEVGIIFDAKGQRPQSIHSFFSYCPGNEGNYGSTHPVVEAHAALGRCMFDQVSQLPTPPGAALAAPAIKPFVASKGG